MPVRSFVWAATPDILMEDGDKPEVPGLGPHGHLDPGPLARPPVLLRVGPPPDALR